MKYFLFFGVFIYMFLSTSVAAKIGIMQVGTFSSIILVILFFIKLLNDTKNKLFVTFKEQFNIVLLGLFIIIIKIALGQAEQINIVIFLFIVPMFISVLIGTQNRYNKKIIKNLILFFFIAECFLAIFERILTINIFDYVERMDGINIEDWGFRSSAFLGHPLTNALCVSIILGFILISTMKISLKLFYMILGFISLLCFNARAAILIWILLGSIYLISLISNKKTKQKVAISITLFFISVVYFLYELIVNYGFGGRIVNEKINDGSSQTRLDVFDSFLYIKDTDLWFGNANNYIPIMKKLGAAGVENSYVVLVIQYGIPLFVVIVILYYNLIKRFLTHYTLFNKLIILSSFLVVGSANNALVGIAPWGFLILCIYTFTDINFTYKSKGMVIYLKTEL